MRLAPDAFWRATPREMAAALRGVVGARSSAGPMRRAELSRLMDRYPD